MDNVVIDRLLSTSRCLWTSLNKKWLVNLYLMKLNSNKFNIMLLPYVAEYF